MLAAIACALVVVSGCTKQEEPTTTPPPAPGAAGDTVKKAVSAIDTQTQVVTQKVGTATTAATAQADAANAKVQGMIDQAKKYIAEGKWTEASTTLKQLGSQTLTPEQKSVVDSLMAQVQKAMGASITTPTTPTADDAAKAAGGLVIPK